MNQLRDRALRRAFSDLRSVPGFKGAVVLYLTEDALGLVIKSTLPEHMAAKLIQEAAAFTRGERGSIIQGVSN